MKSDISVTCVGDNNNVYDAIQRNAHSAYIGSEEADLKFMEILYDKQKTAGERAEILLGGNV